MKLVTVAPASAKLPRLGALVGEDVVDVGALAQVLGASGIGLGTMEDYLRDLPGTEERLRALLDRATRGEGIDAPGVRLDPRTLHLFAPVPAPAALLDFGLTPRHLANSARTLLKREFGGLVAAIVSPIAKRLLAAKSTGEVLPYYKGNHHTVIGPGDVMGWPSYSAYLDIEPELALVLGDVPGGIAGYLIFNDASARDIQLPEMFGTGPARSKDFDRGNGLGPWLVTPDEIPDPLNLKVTVTVGDAHRWEGHTSEYSRRPAEVVEFIRTIFTPIPGTVVGMGTVPDTTGLDRDVWLEPGDEVHIAIEGLGTLVQHLPEAPKMSAKGRWDARGWERGRGES